MVKDTLNRPQQRLEIHKTINVPPSEVKERAALRNCSIPSTNTKKKKKKKKEKEEEEEEKKRSKEEKGK
jgi:hypothetical protein